MTGRGARGREGGRKEGRERGREGAKTKKAMIYCDKVNLARNSLKSKEIFVNFEKKSNLKGC